MIKLSERLQKIADFVEPGASVADIGADHGLLSIALRASGQSPRVIFSDINTGPLEKARENMEKHLPGERPDLRVGNGLRTLKPAETDIVVIAGMGGLLIAEILGDDLSKSKTYRKLILQPRTAANKLRSWLFKNGFRITDEALAREGERLCEIIAATSGGETMETQPEDLDLEISPILFAKKDPLLVEFIENKIRMEMRIYRAVKASAANNKDAKLEESERRIASLLRLIDVADE
jgi:tRNA (adenine22-N1)-methyltransferase